MLFLHGWQDDLRTFDVLASLLSADHRIVRLDLPGFGGSETPRSAWHLDDYTMFVRDFVDKLGMKVDVLIGHSLGGRIVIKGISGGVLDADKIVLIASAGVARRNILRSALFLILAKMGRLLTAMPPLTRVRGSLQRGLYKYLGSDYLAAGPLKETFRNIIKEDLSVSTRAISRPTLLIWGSEDTETPLRDGRRMATFIPGAALEVIPGAGHFIHREEPRKVSELIRKFVS